MSRKAQLKKKGLDWRPKFLELLREFGVVTYAAEGAGISRRTAYRYRNQSEKFAKQWDDALAASVHKLEQEARKRALSKSDTLLIFLLKSLKPETYKDRYQVEHAGGHKIVVQYDDRYATPASSGSGGGYRRLRDTEHSGVWATVGQESLADRQSNGAGS